MPLYTTTQVQSALASVKNQTTGTSLLEVFTEFPSTLNKVSEGFYVARVYQADRVKNENGITPGSHIYNIKDVIEMYLVAQQVNPSVDSALGVFTAFLDNSLFSGYFLREQTIEQQYVNNSERYKVVFELTRLAII